jgi:hypothetical protein
MALFRNASSWSMTSAKKMFGDLPPSSVVEAGPRTMSAVPVPGSLGIRRTKDGPRLVLALCGELDLGSAPVLESELSNPVAASYRHIVVDLTQLAFMDSRGLGALSVVRRRHPELTDFAAQ